jgi:hypothetical protein
MGSWIARITIRAIVCAPGVGLATSISVLAAGSIAHAQASEPPAVEQVQPGVDMPRLVLSPWTKFCLKSNSGTEAICITGDGRIAAEPMQERPDTANRDPALFEQQQARLQQELRRRADEARHRLERQQLPPRVTSPADQR